MKRIITTTENWLLILPLLIWLVETTVTGTSSLDIHLHDTCFVFANISIGLIFLAMSVLPFICHLLVCSNVNKKLLFWHVLLSCSLMTVFFCCGHFFSYNGLGGMPRRYYDYAHWNDYFLSASEVFIVSLMLFYFMLQLLLLLYTVIRLIKK